MQIEPNVRKEGQHHQAGGEPAMGEQSEKRIGRQGIAPFEMEHHQDDQGSARKYADYQVEIEEDGHRNAEQGRVRNRFAKVGKPPPYDKAPRRPGHESEVDAGEQGSREEIVQHRSVSQAAVPAAAIRRGTVSGMNRFIVFMGNQDHHVIARIHGSLEVMRDQQYPATEIAADLFDQLMERALSGKIDPLGWFVENQQSGPVNQSPSEQQPLKLASRQSRDRRIAQPLQTDGSQGSVNIAGAKRPVRVIRRRTVKGSVGLIGSRCGT